MMNGESGRTVKTTATSLEILELIKNNHGATMAFITDELGMSKSTVHAHLKTLQECNYIRKRGERYDISFKFLQYTAYLEKEKDEYRSIKARVEELAEIVGVETDYDAYENGQMVFVYGLPVSRTAKAPDHHSFKPGMYFHMHSTATGKACLAELPDETVESIIQYRGLPKQTDNTITSEAELFDELDEIRSRGFAINDEEAMEGYRTIGVAVKSPMGTTIGGLSIGGPCYRVEEKTLIDHEEQLRNKASAIESDLRELTQF